MAKGKGLIASINAAPRYCKADWTRHLSPKIKAEMEQLRRDWNAGKIKGKGIADIYRWLKSPERKGRYSAMKIDKNWFQQWMQRSS